jgi:cytoskeleton protein RodZ
MSEIGQVSVGQALRDAREAQGITLDAAAQRLHLMQRQVEAMETDDFDSLGQPVFARGFVRNYARMLGLAPEALLANMAGAPAEAAVVSHAAPPAPRSWLTSPWLILLLLGLLLMMTVPVALYLWLNSDVENVLVSHAPAVQQRPAPRVAPVVPAPAPAPAPVVGLPEGQMPASLPADPAPAEPNAAANPSALVAAVPAAPVVVAPSVAPVMSPVASVPPPAASMTPPVAAKGSLRLVFNADSWTEVKDASGRMLLRKLNPAGSSVDLQGQPPFEMVIGDASQVQLTYNGRPVDLKPYIAVTVARFTLEK